METISVDLWSANLQTRCTSLEMWLDQVEQRVVVAVGRGAQLFIMPEFCCAQWLSFVPDAVPAEQHLAWLHTLTESALAALRDMSMRHGIAIMPGTMPELGTAVDGTAGFYNRAWFLTPEGSVHFQDKLSLTPLEADGSAGQTLPGTRINVFVWRGLRIAMPVCLDVEYTSLWSLLGQADVDLVIIAAKTDMITGFNRVFGCAQARAIELQTVICVVGAVGAPLTDWAYDTGMGGAAVFLPCDGSVSDSGVWAYLPAMSAQENSDIALHAPAIPVGTVRAIRHGASEAESRPASWSAAHLAVVETGV